MRYFLDTEFIERGAHYPIDLVSIGIVAEDGREFYRQSLEFNPKGANDWVKANVFPHLKQCPTGWSLEAHVKVSHMAVLNPNRGFEMCEHSQCPWYSLDEIKADIITFVGDDKDIEFWGYFADYDWVVFCQVMGRMVDLPEGWPMHCKDLKQWQTEIGAPKLDTVVDQTNEHHALADAAWNARAYLYLKNWEASR